MPSEGHKPTLGRAAAAVVALLSVCALAHGAPKYQVLHSFTGTDGWSPYAGVTLDDKGNLYGTTAGGGSGTKCTGGCGVVFELTPQASANWTETVLYNFQGGSDGWRPVAPVAFDSFGNLYGTTENGGDSYCDCGTVFELTRGPGVWTESTLLEFNSNDGAVPTAGVTLDASGNLYGTAVLVYELSPAHGKWKEKILHRFTPKSKYDGLSPYAGLILDGAGNLYGETAFGGTGCENNEGCGTVYELAPRSGGGWRELVLHRFNGTDGAEAASGALFMDRLGRLYGTTVGGGTYGYGTVFKLTPGARGHWEETVLHSFGVGAGGNLPWAGVVMDKSGNLYGTTGYGGSSGCGVLYRLAPTAKDNWKYTVLHTFGTVGDGCLPMGNLAIDSKGNLYGGTIFGGTYGYGIVFELAP